MSSSALFTINEIVGATLSISLPSGRDGRLESIVQALQAGKFKTTSAYAADLSNSMEDLFTKLTFHGKGFAFGLLRTKLAAQFLDGLEFVDPNRNPETLNVDPSKVFAHENLEQASSDFNYILGLVLGKLNADNNRCECIFEIQLSKEVSATRNLNHLLTMECKPLFGNATDLKLRGIDISMTERLFGSESLSGYHILGTQNKTGDKGSYDANATFKIKHVGPIDFHDFVNESILRLNNLATNIMVDLDE